ncbi:WASH complex subunit 5-like isoform X3 [Zingiber officinale]|uniref:WASH complex subunit 5-like isoform X3 n=1 Tax=Zingiber officinale TaxID=94328 RepID=UPI001C4C9523|nr:WASH complex subunit 5-like isoform X3 [Zingiber officinale]
MASSSDSSQPNRGDGDGDGDGSSPLHPELLQFCSRAQTLISELFLLSDRIPSEFLDRRFDPVLFDLRYLDSPGAFESRIEGNAALEALEDQVRESCSEFLKRFFLLANGAVLYYLELLRYLDSMQEGLSLQCTLDSVLDDECSRQLLTESIQLFGCFLLLVEHRIGGLLREKLLVTHLRFSRCFNSPNIKHICSFCRMHRAASDMKYDVNPFSLRSTTIYIENPEDILARFPFPKLVVDAIICALRNADLYDQIRHYPDPQHRSMALSLQSRCMYVLLFYSPEFLHDGFIMREIVDRFFKDHWVVPLFLHHAVDLFVSWDAFKEAKSSLSSCHSPTLVRDCCQNHCKKVRHLSSEIELILSNGVLTKDYVLDRFQNLFSLVRDCNVALRWLLLHRICIDRKLREIVTSVGIAEQVDEDCLLAFLLRTSQLEFQLKQLFVELLENKESFWHEKKHCVSRCIEELSGYLSRSWASSCKIKNENLKDWFEKLSVEVYSLDHKQPGISGRIVYRIISALKDILKLHQVRSLSPLMIEENLQVKKSLLEMEKHLQDMIKANSLSNDSLLTFSVITDATYAWGYVSRLGGLLGRMIEGDPSVMRILHMFFLKFKKWMDVPLSRIAQSQSADLQCTSNYYFSQFAAQICSTLDIVPGLLLGLFKEDGIHDRSFYLANRVDKEKLQEFMQMDLLLKSGRAANKICVISQGIMVISRNFLGLINMDLKDWLVEQIIKGLKMQIQNKLNSFFLSSSVSRGTLEIDMRMLSTYIQSQMQMMEILQDLLHINGRSIWEEVLANFLKESARNEHSELIKQKRDVEFSSALLNSISKSKTFFGNLLIQVLQLTDPSRSMFIEPMSGWFDAEGNELLGLLFFDVLDSCIGQAGLCILDSLLCILVKNSLEHALSCLNSRLDCRILEELRKMDGNLGPAPSLPLLGWTSYKSMIKMGNESMDPLVSCFATTGQLQLLRCFVAFKLRSSSKIKVGSIYSAVEGLNASIYVNRDKTIEALFSKQENTDQKMEDNPFVGLLQALNRMQKFCGILSPLQTNYILKEPPTLVARSASILSISQLSRYVLDTHLGTLTSKTNKSITDFSPVVIGLGTFLKQFHPSHATQYIQYMGQYVRITAELAYGVYDPQILLDDPASEVLKSAFWLMYFCRFMGAPKSLVDSCLPPSLVAMLQM